MAHHAVAVLIAWCWLAFTGAGWLPAQGPGEPLASLEKRAQSGDAKAQNELGVRYQTGDGVEKNPVVAVRWYRRAAQQGNATAYFNLGAAFYSGNGVEVDENVACMWFFLAAEAGESSGKDAYAREQKDPTTMNGTNCMLLAGDAYLQGSEVPKDTTHALRLYTSAAQGGNFAADMRLYAVYSEGIGVLRDMEAAMRFLQTAADGHDRRALLVLGGLYEKGKGVPQDLHRACEDYKQAAQAGLPEAFVALGTLKRDGIGTKRDLVEAALLYNIGSRLGDSTAKALFESVKAGLSKKELQSLQDPLRQAVHPNQISCH